MKALLAEVIAMATLRDSTLKYMSNSEMEITDFESTCIYKNDKKSLSS